MTGEPPFDYRGHAQRLGFVMQVLDTVDLDGILATTERAHTLGPFVDPTKYRDALQRGDMDAMAELARALQPAAAVWREKIAPKLAGQSAGERNVTGGERFALAALRKKATGE